MTVSYSIYKLIVEEFGIRLKTLNTICGHSLGEYSALVSIGSLKFEDAILFFYMKEESQCKTLYQKEKDAMLAVLGLKIKK